MPIRKTITSSRVPVKIYTDDIEPQAVQQLQNIANLPFIHSHVAAMPDVHLGQGATIGSVIPCKGAIIPAAVGVDIGCGMNAIRLSIKAKDLPDNLRGIRSAIEQAVPVGFSMHETAVARQPILDAFSIRLDKLLEKHPDVLKKQRNPRQTWRRQLGTLGGGNHFIELCLDENDAVWIMLHSGSRGVGNRIGQYFIKLAKKDMETHIKQLPDKDLSYFCEGARHFDDYFQAIIWAQDYALENRRVLMRLIIEVLRGKLPEFSISQEAINCHHNYVSIENHFGQNVYITRKGAIRAERGDLGIIPGSMGTKSYIVCGKGSADSFNSCAHGAGRRMSRNDAKKRFTPADLAKQTEGVECRKDEGVLDEIPGSYKDIDEVMANQSDLVEVVHTLRQVICVKG